MPSAVPVTVTAVAHASVERAFDAIAPIDLSLIFMLERAVGAAEGRLVTG